MPSRSSSSVTALRGARASADAHDVIVVGGGLVGCAAAIAAAQAGLRVALVAGAESAVAAHAFTDEPWDRRVYALSRATQRFLESLRIWPQVNAARVGPVRDMQIYAAARDSAGLHFSAFEAGSDALAFIVEHRELARVFDAALAFQQGVQRFSEDAAAITPFADAVEVTVGATRLRAALVIGADGARSRVRDAVGLASEWLPYEQRGVVANFHASRPHGGVARQWFTDDGVVALLPLPGDHLSLVWSAPEALADALMAASPQELAARVQALAGTDVGELTPVGGASAFPLARLITPRQAGPRTVLIGDAAHVVHPLAGQGLNLGMQDAEVLVDILRNRESFRDCGDPKLLRRYERARSEPVFAMRQVTDGLQRLFAAQDPGLRRVRTTGMQLVDRLPVLKKSLIRQAMG